MFSRFFIDRPIFATVLSLVVTLAGGIAGLTLPVTLYPEITPPTVEVSAVYPGANAIVVSDTVAAPIEQQVNGVEGMIYMSSRCTNDGAYSLTVTFAPGVDLNQAQILVQNRVSLAQPVLPDLVRRRGVTVKKKSPTVLMIVNLQSPDSSRDNLYLSNYATIQLRDELSRLNGVGDITFLGQRDYSMRVWLDPERLASRGVTTEDVARTIEQQNVQVAAGQIGQPPVARDQVFQYTMSTLGRLSDDHEFGDMIIRADALGEPVRLRDVAEVQLGAVNYDQICTLDGKPSVALSVYQLPGSNALETARQVRRKMDELRQRFPDGVDYDIVYDTTPFIEESVQEVYHALRDAVLLVAIVVLVFLQGWRAAVIPLVAVPVAIIGTFAAMAAFHFSINTLTLFGLVLAIGIVVDDAIVVVEAIEYHIEHGLSPRDAAIQAMDEVAGPVIAVGLVLSAVFAPCIFIRGIIGEFFQQFALTIAISTVLSAFNSLTLSPALAVLLLRPRHPHTPTEPGTSSDAAASTNAALVTHGSSPTTAISTDVLPRPLMMIAGGWLVSLVIGERLLPWLNSLPLPYARELAPWVPAALGLLIAAGLHRGLNRLLGAIFHRFNRVFSQLTESYVGAVGGLLRVRGVVLLAYGGLLYLTHWGFTITPVGFIPPQDKGYLLVNLQLPDSASLGRAEEAVQAVEKIARQHPAVKHTLSVAGQSILLGANAPNLASVYLMLDDFEFRRDPKAGAAALARRLGDELGQEIPDAVINVFGAPAVDGLGAAGGFKLVIEDRGDHPLKTLQQVADAVVAEGQQQPELAGFFSSFRADTPWQQIELDRTAAKMMGLNLAEVFHALQVNFGSLYINDFNRFGRTWQVNVQASSQFRLRPEDLRRLTVRNRQGNMVSLATIGTIRDGSGPLMLVRYNLYPSALINVDAGAGVSSGTVIQRMEELARKQLPPAMRAEWTELAWLQSQSGQTAAFAFVLAVVLVFLVLAAQYESWSLPLAVILVVPTCLLCSITGVLWAGLDINIFTQVGFVVLVGLACKNAILIVEFARARTEQGLSTREATLAACRLRLRPIIMTSLAFILGVVPLMFGQGAGAEMRQTLGVAVFSGMLGVTLMGIFLTPVFFDVIQSLAKRRSSTPTTPPAP